jgi:hypothetical protein
VAGFLLDCLIPFVSDLLLPVVVILDFLHSVADNLERLLHLEVLHELVVIKIVGELEQIVDLSFLFLFDLLLGLGPGGLAALL